MAATIKNLTSITHNGLTLPRVTPQLTFADKLGGCKARWAIARMKYTLEPGIYAVGNPTDQSPVLVSANYKLSFDFLRKELTGIDAWIMVIDTKGINVWCAAGKGTFGTAEIVRRIEKVNLEKIVSHRKIILPQLGAVGVAAHKVKKKSGFMVIYGPVRARDIKAFIDAGNKATPAMRQVRFTFYDRLVLTPVEFTISAKYALFVIAAMFLLSGLNRQGYSTQLTLDVGFRAVFNVLIAYLGGTVIAPLLLPWLPGTSFSVKGLSVGLVLAAGLSLIGYTGAQLETLAWILLVTAITSFTAMNFTGASTYTSLSGVNKEMKYAVPIQLTAAIAGLVIWLISRFI